MGLKYHYRCPHRREVEGHVIHPEEMTMWRGNLRLERDNHRRGCQELGEARGIFSSRTSQGQAAVGGWGSLANTLALAWYCCLIHVQLCVTP